MNIFHLLHHLKRLWKMCNCSKEKKGVSSLCSWNHWRESVFRGISEDFMEMKSNEMELRFHDFVKLSWSLIKISSSRDLWDRGPRVLDEVAAKQGRLCWHDIWLAWSCDIKPHRCMWVCFGSHRSLGRRTWGCRWHLLLRLKSLKMTLWALLERTRMLFSSCSYRHWNKLSRLHKCWMVDTLRK